MARRNKKWCDRITNKFTRHSSTIPTEEDAKKFKKFAGNPKKKTGTAQIEERKEKHQEIMKEIWKAIKDGKVVEINLVGSFEIKKKKNQD